MPKDNAIKFAFLKVKEDILTLEKEYIDLKTTISAQNEALSLIKGILDQILEKIALPENPKNEVSSGNEGVNQSINHLINQSFNQSIINQSSNHEDLATEEHKTPLNPFKTDFKPDNPSPPTDRQLNQSIINQSSNQSSNQSFNHDFYSNSTIDPNFQSLKNNLEGVFKILSKQELKLFLTIYQIEDEGKDPVYSEISSKMGLSEHCIRSHISSLLKKNAPLYKKRTNSKINIIRIKPDFKSLNLKQKLIAVYYDNDPHQTTLFDI